MSDKTYSSGYSDAKAGQNANILTPEYQAGRAAAEAEMQKEKEMQQFRDTWHDSSAASNAAAAASNFTKNLGPTTGWHLLAIPVFIVGVLALFAALGLGNEMLDARGWSSDEKTRGWHMVVAIAVVAGALFAAGVWLKRKGDKELGIERPTRPSLFEGWK